MDSEHDVRLLSQESPDVLLVLLPNAPRFTMAAAPACGSSLRPTDVIRCADISGLKVLVVDDEPNARALICALLEECKGAGDFGGNHC